MSTLLDLPPVSECSVEGCSYNHDGCHAGAVTVGGANGTAACTTFIPLDVEGGLAKVTAHVGACQRADCTHNDHLECTAAAIQVGPGADPAACLTFAAA